MSLSIPILQTTITEVGEYSLNNRYGKNNWNIDENQHVTPPHDISIDRYKVAVEIARTALESQRKKAVQLTESQEIDLNEREIKWLRKEIDEMEAAISRDNRNCCKVTALSVAVVVLIVLIACGVVFGHVMPGP